MLEKEKIEDDQNERDKKEEEKKGKKAKKGKRTHLLKFQVKEVIDGKDALKPGLILLCVTETGPPRNPNQVKGAQAEPGEVYRVVSMKKPLKEDKVLRLADCRLLSAKGKVGEEYPVGKTWNGSLPVKSLELLPEEQRKSPIAYFGDNKSFTAFWESFTPFDKKAPAPQVDFSKNVVVVMKNLRHPEPIVGLKARLDEGTGGQGEQFIGAVADDDVFRPAAVEPGQRLPQWLCGGVGVEAQAPVGSRADGADHLG